MTNPFPAAAVPDDAQLVALCREGDREAFGRIVVRYQGVVCGLAYSATGNLARSEDLAQETFLAAWGRIGELREPAKLRAWLCGIARNLARNSFRRRDPVRGAEPIDEAHALAAPAPDPSEEAVSAEEAAILWRSLERIPETYREPLVLFYRGGRSVEGVAAELELSEEAVRQRLSRGRKLLQAEVASFVEGALRRSAPGRAFAAGVMAGLPVAAASGGAAAVAAKGGTAAKTAAGAAWIGVFAGPLLALLGGYLGYRVGMESARTEDDRRFVRDFTRRLWACILFGWATLVPLALWAAPLARAHPGLIGPMILGTILIYAGVFGAMAIWTWRRTRALSGFRTQAGPIRPSGFEYRSRTALLGWPLVHVRFGGTHEPAQAPVHAWFAAGGAAVGRIFAFGGFALAPVSLGGISFGLLSWGGAAFGACAFGGFAVGGGVLGGVATGWLAAGGAALGWKAAVGGLALSREFALGGRAFAPHANDAVARAFLEGRWLFRGWLAVVGLVSRRNFFLWLNLTWALPLLAMWWRLAALRRRREAAARG